MHRAGESALHCLQSRWPRAKSIAVLCGPGNNGGDGYILAALAAISGLTVDLLEIGDTGTDDGRKARRYAEEAGVAPRPYEPGNFPLADVVVDAILGTGLRRAPEKYFLSAIRDVNASGIPVFSLDMPSGLDSDTGNIQSSAVDADATISFVCLQLGLFTGFGANHSGQIYFDSLNVSKKAYSQSEPLAQRITAQQVTDGLRSRPARQHKGDAGHLVLVGGTIGMSGAVQLAGEAALRSGIGLASVATRSEHAGYLNLGCPELMVFGIEKGQDLTSLLDQATAVAVGPGLGRDNWGQGLLSSVLAAEVPAVVDADGITLLSVQPVLSNNWILTPHPGEAAKLLGVTAREIQSDRVRAAFEIQERYGGVCVLKGAGTLVVGPNRKLWLCDRGNSGMASGGMGDLLTGVIGSLLAQRLELEEAARLGVWLHSAAADLAATGGKRGMISRDLLAPLRLLVDQPAAVDE